MRRARFDERSDNGGAMVESQERNYDNDLFPCSGCKTSTKRVDMSNYGARCKSCYESFCTAAFRAYDCVGSAHDKATMAPADYAASRLRKIKALRGHLTLAQQSFLKAFESKVGSHDAGEAA